MQTYIKYLGFYIGLHKKQETYLATRPSKDKVSVSILSLTFNID